MHGCVNPPSVKYVDGMAKLALRLRVLLWETLLCHYYYSDHKSVATDTAPSYADCCKEMMMMMMMASKWTTKCCFKMDTSSTA